MILDVLLFVTMALAPGKAPDPGAAGQPAGAAPAAQAAGAPAAAAPGAGAGPAEAPLFGGDLPSAEQLAALDKFQIGRAHV